MARNRPPPGKRPKTRRAPPRSIVEPRKIVAPKPPVHYGKPLLLLEDPEKNTYEYVGGAWVPYESSIAQCRLDSLVTELPQKVNKMTRYEVRRPVAE